MKIVWVFRTHTQQEKKRTSDEPLRTACLLYCTCRCVCLWGLLCVSLDDFRFLFFFFVPVTTRQRKAPPPPFYFFLFLYLISSYLLVCVCVCVYCTRMSLEADVSTIEKGLPSPTVSGTGPGSVILVLYIFFSLWHWSSTGSNDGIQDIFFVHERHDVDIIHHDIHFAFFFSFFLVDSKRVSSLFFFLADSSLKKNQNQIWVGGPRDGRHDRIATPCTITHTRQPCSPLARESIKVEKENKRWWMEWHGRVEEQRRRKKMKGGKPKAPPPLPSLLLLIMR